MNRNKIRIGTRGSKLALRQAALVQAALERTAGEIGTEIVILHTKGDKIQDRPLAEIGDKGVFSSEFGRALAAGTIDIAVHSAKDLPMSLAEGSVIAAVLPRADVRDVLVIPRGGRMPCKAARGGMTDASAGEKKTDGRFVVSGEGRASEEHTDVSVDERETDRCMFRIGSGSRRRRQQAERLWDNVVFEDIRGNVDTRLRKLQEGGYDGIILAKAGLDRLGITSDCDRDFTFCPLDPERFLPAACQGIVAVETLRDSDAAALCERFTDSETHLCFLVEREVLAQLAVECSDAAAVWCRQAEETLILDVMYGDSRKQFTCRAGTEEGLAMARRAAGAVKGKDRS